MRPKIKRPKVKRPKIKWPKTHKAENKNAGNSEYSKLFVIPMIVVLYTSLCLCFE